MTDRAAAPAAADVAGPMGEAELRETARRYMAGEIGREEWARVRDVTGSKWSAARPAPAAAPREGEGG